jgi:hypothetical protein
MHEAPIRKEWDYEGEASRFAGALLMPTWDAQELLFGGLTLARLGRLKASWGISMAGLIVRAHQLAAIDRLRQESLFKQISARGWRREEPVLVRREEPALIPRLIEAKFGQVPDWSNIGRSFDLPPHLVRELAHVSSPDQERSAVTRPVQLRQQLQEAEPSLLGE